MRKSNIIIESALFLVLVLVLKTACINSGVSEVYSSESINTQSSQLSYETEAKRDLLALIMAYPEHIKDIEKAAGNTIYILMQSGDKIIYDDMKQKDYAGKLANADIEDMMQQVYPLNDIDTLMQDNFDPGRIRNYAFLHEVYGNAKGDIEDNLTNVSLGSNNCSFNKSNNAAVSLKTTFQEISVLIKSSPNVYSFVYPVNGTYNYRCISGTNQLSPHAFGIAIDLKSNKYDYWKWATKEQGQSRLGSYPKELVRIFENNNFIWGGKWAHFDILHFEYRPELIIKSRYYMDTNSTIFPWYSGYPDTEQTKAYIGIIDSAFE